MKLGTLGATLALALASPPPGALAAPPAQVLAGDADVPRPRVIPLGATLLQPSALLAARLEVSDPVVVDSDGTELPGGTHANLLARVGVGWSSHELAAPWLIAAELELDAVSGLVTDRPDVEGEGLPNDTGLATATLRKAVVTLSYEGFLSLRAGVTTSHWGLGLVANDGAHGWTPGSARFIDPRGGDRVLRGQIVVKTPGEVAFGAALAFDQVLHDESLRPGDKAHQVIFAAFAEAPRVRVGAYTVGRFQRSEDHAEVTAYVADLYGELRWPVGDALLLTLAAEAAAVFGKTTLAPSAVYPEHDLLQLGAVLRVGLGTDAVGGVLDLVYASGDANLDDDRQSAFKADPNFDLGLVLFPYVVAAQTGRSAFTARSPALTGYPPDDLDRLPTRGSVSNTFALFPRLWFRPLAGLEAYGGPLIAFAPTPPTDPLLTRLAGGDPRNARDASPGSYLGTELDLGLRYHFVAWGSALTAGLELGLLLPGSALDARGVDAESALVAAGRATLSWKL